MQLRLDNKIKNKYITVITLRRNEYCVFNCTNIQSCKILQGKLLL